MDVEDEHRQALQREGVLDIIDGLDASDPLDRREIEYRRRLALDHAAGRNPPLEEQAELLRMLDTLLDEHFDD